MEETHTQAGLNGRALPTHVDLTGDDQRIGFTPRELDMIKEQFGRPLTGVIADTDSDDKLVALGWLKLRRAGYPVTWDDMRDIVVWMGDTPVDPTNGRPPATLPLSATSGE